MRSFRLLLLGFFCIGYRSEVFFGQSAQASADSATPASRFDSAQIIMPGLHNVYRISDKLYSGSSPDGDPGFRSLQKLDIKTIISVDGARPDVTTAHSCGMRYVHIPFGYDGIPPGQILLLAKAVRDLPGPIYIHCHPGMHRGPAAASAIHLCLDKSCTVDRALAEMHRAGTDPHYTGLYAVPLALRRPTSAELDRVPSDFPEIARVPDLAECMVEIDQRWDDLKQIRAAGWRTPATHQDLDPAHEALMLRESFQEALRVAARFQRAESAGTHHRTAEVGQWLAAAADKTSAFEKDLRTRADHSTLDHAFHDMGASCTRCHAKYRDVPQSKGQEKDSEIERGR